MIVTFGSIRGAPGVTSWSLLLAAAWPDPTSSGRVVLEADAAGGVLGARYGFGVDPGVVSLIAALRRADRVDAAAHGRALASGLYVVPGPESGEQTRAVWHGSTETVAGRLAADERVWLVDAGRLDAGSPVVSFGWLSSLTVLVSGPAMEDLVQVPPRVAWLQSHGARVGVLVVGAAGHDTAELGEFFGTGLVWVVRADSDLVAVVGAVLSGAVRARRSWAWRTALELAATIATHTTVSGDRPASREVVSS
jgi:MinD-like ATPase involved in chromosome partitioning or flagellar assembly